MPTSALPETIPKFDISNFAQHAKTFVFDLVRMQDCSDIPRPFPHRHGYYHLIWMSRASGVHMIDFARYEVRPNSVFFISPGQVHAWRSTVPPEGYVVNFSPEFFFEMFPRPDALAEFPFFHLANTDPVLYLDSERAAELAPLIEAIEAEFVGTAPWRHDVIRSLFLVFLVKLRRLHRPLKPEHSSPQSYLLTKKYKLLIEEKFLELGSVQDYAGLLNVTDRHLNEATKKAVGKTANQLISERILMEAKRLLIQSGMGVSEVAYQLNFDDPAYFCRFFRKGTALSPGEFKKRHAAPV
jgi:AraC-like DNA-binding protein